MVNYRNYLEVASTVCGSW